MNAAPEMRILMLEDDQADATLTERSLRKAGLSFVAKRVDTRETFARALEEFSPTVVLSDYQLPSFDGLAAAKLVRQRSAALPLIIVTGALGDEVAVDLLKAGANDYILKDRLARLPFAIKRALSEASEIASRRQAEEHVERLSRARTAVMHCNQALVHAQDEASLLDDVCKTIVEQGGYPLCWVAYAEPGEEKRVRPVAWAGVDEGYLAALSITWADTELGRGPAGTAIRTGETQLTMDTGTDPNFAPWREAAQKRGYAAVIAIPLIIDPGPGAVPIGALTIASSQMGVWSQDERDLLGDLAGDLSYGVAALRAQAEQKKTQEELRLVQERLAGIFDASPDGMVFTTTEGVCMDANRSFLRLSGYEKEDLVARRRIQEVVSTTVLSEANDGAGEALPADEASPSEATCLRKDGSRVPVELTTFAVKAGGAPIGLASIVADITQRKLSEEKIRHLAYYDSVANLPNRLLFQDRLDQALALARRNEKLVAVHFIDLDNFKLVNDSLGHVVGDVLLRVVSERLRRAVRTSDTVARLGGDEFAVIQTDLPHKHGAAALAGKLVRTLAEPFVVDHRQLHATASIGITLFPTDDPDGNRLLQNADMAMYRAKKLGRNNFQFYDASLNAELQDRIRIVADLHAALERGEFMLHYQPQIGLSTGDTVGMEALIRWQHPLRGLRMPGEFIAIAEEEGLIGAVGDWTLQEACRQNHAWQARGLPARRVAVNISAKQFEQEEQLLRTIFETLERTGLAPEWLEVELTESTLLNDVEAGARALLALHEKGIQVAIDDFGTGYSSLGYLSRFRVDRLKIDQSFVRGLPDDRDAATVVKTIIELGHNLGMTVIAEGIETEGQLEFLSNKGCDEGQGYYLHRPLTPDRLEIVLEAEKQREQSKERPAGLLLS